MLISFYWNGLKLYWSGDASTYLAVYVERSTLKFRLSCGQQQMTLVETKYNVSDGASQTILVRYAKNRLDWLMHCIALLLPIDCVILYIFSFRLLRVEERNTTSSYCMGSVKLNNSYSMNGEQRLDENDGHQLTWPWRIHLGGRPSSVPTPDEILFLPGMTGCTYSLQVGFYA
jgi:hypothetical protein